MDWSIEHTIAAASAIAAISAAVAAWYSYRSSKATLQALFNKERPMLNVESRIFKGENGVPSKVKLYIENFGASFAVFEKVEFECYGSLYDVSQESSIELLKEFLSSEINGKFEIVQLIEKWRIGCDKSKDLIVATPDNSDDLDAIHDMLYRINVKVIHVDCHGKRREE